MDPTSIFTDGRGGSTAVTVARRQGSVTAAIACTVAMAASGIVLTVAPGGAAAGCAPRSGVGRSALAGIATPLRGLGSWGPKLSADGRYVAFVSYDEDLVAGDGNQQADVFRADRATGTMQRVSLDTNGSEFEEHTAEASISADGDLVAFASDSDVHVREMEAVRTIDVSVNDAGTDADDWSGAPVLSPEGRFVAFTSRARNLVTPDRGSGSIEAYLRDLEGGTIERISIGTGGRFAPTWSWAEAVSAGGRFVAFTAGAAGGTLTPHDTYPGSDVFIRDRQTRTTEIVSVGVNGESIGGWFVAMSADGMRILFGSGPQPDSKPAVFLRDRAAGTTQLLAPLVTTWRRPAGSTPAPLAFVGERAGRPAALSADGRFAAVQTTLPTGPEDTNGADDIVLVDLTTGTWQAVTRSSAGCSGEGPSGEPVLSRDGSVVGFTSEADDLGGDDTDRITNVYVRQVAARRTERVSAAPATSEPSASNPDFGSLRRSTLSASWWLPRPGHGPRTGMAPRSAPSTPAPSS